MLNTEKLQRLCRRRGVGDGQLGFSLVRRDLDRRAATAAVRNWQKGLLKPRPRREDIGRLAAALGVEEKDLSAWRSSCRFAPISSRKAQLVAQLILGRGVQDAMDVLSLTPKRAAGMINKILKAAVADADEQQADVENLYVSEARVDDAGVRIGTKRWIAKDRGRAHPISRRACHIYVSVAER
jgi:large subunit ribosomal protein L22